MKLKGMVILGFLALCLAPGLAFSDLKNDFDNLVDFSVRMDNIQRRLESEEGPSGMTDKLLILSGAVASVQFLGGEGENFVAALELVEGEWVGMEDVRMFKAYLVVFGTEFEARLPVRRSREAVPNEILVNSQILAVGRIVDVDVSDAEIIPIIECFYIREL